MNKDKEPELVYAFDPLIKRRVVHVVIGDYAISLVTGHKFKIKKEEVKKKNDLSVFS